MEQRRFILSEGMVWQGKDYVFTNEHGRPINPRNLLRGFKRALKRAELPLETTIHQVRHSVGSILLADDQNIDAVTELLGHSSRSITERIYAHALPEKKRATGESPRLFASTRGGQIMPTSPNTSPTNEKDAASIQEYRVPIWWSDGDSNPGPSACKAESGFSSAVRPCPRLFPNHVSPSTPPSHSPPTSTPLAVNLAVKRQSPPDCSEGAR